MLPYSYGSPLCECASSSEVLRALLRVGVVGKLVQCPACVSESTADSWSLTNERQGLRKIVRSSASWVGGVPGTVIGTGGSGDGNSVVLDLRPEACARS